MFDSILNMPVIAISLTVSRFGVFVVNLKKVADYFDVIIVAFT